MESSSDWEESEPGVRRFRSDFPETARDNVTLKRHSSDNDSCQSQPEDDVEPHYGGVQNYQSEDSLIK
ncbi:uncharacterized protein LOC108736854 isoform X2 [Agrilus planipennis]|uniref:Uncharacterized protein LOC108736854 isoform X2 n=1 Tax=Agrilus planipennis TaxID=224129 RepID=A0A1W4WXR9_AGRPL|nr:uncharacterized protein LOC108736854 isoform X2 [Agrilus planipennis]